jgi:TolB-like protein/Flp pilus assembly protein TadD
VVSWLLIQIATQVFPFFEIPNWAVRLVVVLLLLGFPIALILAWAYELTPAGIKRTEEIAPDKSTSPSRPRRAAPASEVPEKSIAVLPFENLSDDRENAYFADGVHDDILSSLAKVADLKVISRTSVQQYKTGARNLREIGEALGVAHILEGTVRRSGNRVRVNAQLINAQTDAHLWGDTFDRELTDLFAIQSELAERITIALRANLSPREKASIQIHPTTDLEAYEFYLGARDLFRWSGAGDAQENGEKALPLIDQAVARDPQFALAYCLASRVHAEIYWFGYDKRPERLAKAKAAAEMALRLQPDLGDAHLALTFYYYYASRNYERARSELAAAFRAMPNEAEVQAAFGVLDRRQARWEDAISNLKKARQLDPRNVAAIWNLFETYAYLGAYPEAERAITDGLAVSPQAHFFILARAALDLRRKGETPPLRSALREIPNDFDPGGAVTTIALRVSLMDHDYQEGERLLAASVRDRFNDNGLSGIGGALDGYTVPKTWYEGLVARGRGDKNAADRGFDAARRAVAADLTRWPEDAKTTAMLGLIDAALGRKEDALREGRRAVELLPTSKDALDGPVLATNLAVIYGQVGEQDLALAQLASLIAVPNGPTPGLLRIEPEWEPLRSDPRFEKLVGATS